jgi:hypothetical protein
MTEYEELLWRYRRWLDLHPEGNETLEELREIEKRRPLFKHVSFLSGPNVDILIKYVKP